MMQSFSKQHPSQKSGRVAILVVGVHRSGTSVLTRLINLLGAALPKNLMGPASSNVYGHWESARLVELNDEIFRVHGGKWWNPKPIRRGWFSTTQAQAFTTRAITIIAEEFGSAPLIVIKDPRMCRLAPLYLAAFDQLGIEPRVVLALRHPGEVIKSIVSRDGICPQTVEMLWIRHLLEAEEASRSYPRVWTSYADLLSNWKRTLARIAETLDLTWPNSLDSSAGAIEGAIDPGLRHFDVERNSAPSGVGLLTLRFWKAAQNGPAANEAVLRSEFDDIRMITDELDRLNSMHANPPQHTCYIQVFANQGTGYKETLSVRKSLVSEVWQTLRFEHVERLYTDCRHRLRIDLVNQPALVEVAGISITRDADHTVLYDASSAVEFRRLKHSPSVLTHIEGEVLLVFATDSDPQLKLPLISDFQDASCTLELRLRLITALPGLLHRLHKLQTNMCALLEASAA